jgi:hypothetical protein
MSGPKSYNVEVFDKQLKALFLLQAEVKILWGDLLKISKSSVEHIKNKRLEAFISSGEEEIDSAIQEIDLRFKGTINQKQFDEFYNRIHQRVELLKEIKKSIGDQFAQLQDEEEAQRIYLANKSLYQKLAHDFSGIKKHLLDQLEKSKPDTGEKQQKIQDIIAVKFDFEIPPFQKEQVRDLEQEMLIRFHEARERLGDVLAASGKANTRKAPESKQVGETISANQKLIQKISLQFLKIRDKTAQEEFGKRLSKIKKVKKAQSYYLTELLEDVQKGILQQDLKQRLSTLKSEYDKTEFHFSLSASKNEFDDHLNKALGRDHNRTDEIEALETQFNKLLEQNKQAYLAEAVAKNERAYIRSQLVSALNDLNYQVAAETEVIDFENNSDFLLRIPGQENYLNLRFDEQGRVLYNFLIPEDKADLGIDETAVKLSEMEETCTEFKKMLLELKGQGLDIDLKQEIPISEKALIRIPEYHAKNLSKRVSTQQEKPKKQKQSKKRKPG